MQAKTKKVGLYLFLVVLYCLPIFAINFSMDPKQHSEVMALKEDGGRFIAMSQGCRDEWNFFVKKDPEALVREYCEVVNVRLIYLILIAALLWLAEPRIKELILKNEVFWSKNHLRSEYIIFLYKWIGLGILFMACYGIYKVVGL